MLLLLLLRLHLEKQLRLRPDFCWQDNKGKLISKLDTKNSLLSTVNEFKNYNIRSKIGPAKSNNKIIYIFKKSIKYILNKFFPTIF